MKTLVTILGVFVGLLGATAHGAGGGNTQGTLFAGTGFDWQRTGTNAQVVPVFKSNVFPPRTSFLPVTPAAQPTPIARTVSPASLQGAPALGMPAPIGTQLSKSFMAVTIELTSCRSSPAFRFAECSARVRLKGDRGESRFCGYWMTHEKAELIKLIALDAVPEAGAFKFNALDGAKHDFILACAEATTEEDWYSLGAIGKCLLWPGERPPYRQGPDLSMSGFPPTRESTLKFQACVRAVRADYCGDGVTYTKDHTAIYLYEMPAAGITSAPDFYYEANWDEGGAICVIHSRYESLAPTCQAKFREKKGQTPPGYFCRREPANLDEGLLRDDSTLQD